MTSRLNRAYRRAFYHLYGWATLRLYDELAWAYDPISRFVSAGRWGAWRALALDYVVGPRVLEVGFGTGELLIALHRRGLTVVGLDLSRAMHRVTRRKLARQGVAVPLVRGVAERLPFADASFDTVLSTFPAGYIFHIETLQEVRRVLTPGGRLVIGALIVELPRSLKRPLSIVPNGSADRLWEYVQAQMAEAGLNAAVTWHQDGPARVPVIVCTKSLSENLSPQPPLLTCGPSEGERRGLPLSWFARRGGRGERFST